MESTLAPTSKRTETPPRLVFPCSWFPEDGIGGKCPEDVATLHVEIPIGAGDENPTWSISLEAAVDELIWHNTEFGNDVRGGACVKLAARLRELADKLETAVAR